MRNVYGRIGMTFHICSSTALVLYGVGKVETALMILESTRSLLIEVFSWCSYIADNSILRMRTADDAQLLGHIQLTILEGTVAKTLQS